LSKSLFLSKARYEDDEDQTDLERTLEEATVTLRAGGAIQYDPSELQRLSERIREFQSVTGWQVWGAVLRFFLPGVLLLAALFGLLYLLRSGRL